MTAIYLAARFSRREELKGYALTLWGSDYPVTSRWLTGHEGDTDLTPAEWQRYAREDYLDIEAADLVVVFTDPPGERTSKGGKHVELGIALGLGKAIALIGEPEHLFHYLEDIDRYPTWAHFRSWLFQQRQTHHATISLGS